MSRQRFVLVLIAALLAISGAYYVSKERNAPPKSEGRALFPALAAAMNSVTSVEFRKGAATPTLTVHKVGDQWTIAQRNDYPADVAKLRKLLTALRDAKIVEEKTSDPARYSVIGVEDPAQPGATGTEITITAGAKNVVIVGKSVGETSFVRRPDEKQSYSVEPPISVETEPPYWIDSRLLDVAAAQIQSIEFKPLSGAPFSVHRLNATDNTFGLTGVPAGRKPLDAHALAPAPTTLTNLTAEDVSPAADIDFGQSTQAIVTLADGNDLTLTGVVAGNKHWLQVKSSKDPALTAKVQGRAFEIASYRYDAIFKPVDQLLEPKPTPAPKSATPKAAPPAPKVPAANP
jgi:hypothetical protein